MPATHQPRVSIVVPVYNSAPYLGECLDSLLSQTEPSWECLAVDDGSTDGSAEILDAYAAKDRRIHVLHQPNSGPSAARNVALDIAKGEWIAMLDSDDSWVPDFLEKVLRCAAEFCVDMVQVGIQTYRDGIPGDILLPVGASGVFARKIDKSYLRRTTTYNWDKLLRRELVERYRIRYDTGLKYSEDLPVVMQFCAATDRVGIIGEPLYKLRLHAASATAGFRAGKHPASYYRNMLDSVVRSAEALVGGGFPSSRVAALYPGLFSWLRGRAVETRNCMPAELALNLPAHVRRLQWQLFRLAPWKLKLRAFCASLHRC